MEYPLHQIATILSIKEIPDQDATIRYLLTDSRKILFPEYSLFFSIRGPRRSGNIFIPELYKQGVRCFVVDEHIDKSDYPEAVFLEVSDSVKALQQLAQYHRSQFNIPVIGITGSNGKTIVKEWLYQLLNKDHQIVRSPRSYNSQIGVPLSVALIEPYHTLGIFEAGISTTGEMKQLADIIQPTIGVLTNIGSAHSEGFQDAQQQLNEKLQLFTDAADLIVAGDYIESPISFHGNLMSWGTDGVHALQVNRIEKKGTHTVVSVRYLNEILHLEIPFSDEISIQNAITCWTVMLHLKYPQEIIQSRILQLEPVEMRMQLSNGINQCHVLNDSYSNDIISLGFALSFIKEQAGDKTITVVLSDIITSAQDQLSLYEEVTNLLKKYGVHKLYAIGEAITGYFSKDIIRQEVPFDIELYENASAMLAHVQQNHFQKEYILLKGARKFEFEQIAHWLEEKVHQTVLDINLTALVQNLKIYQSLLAPNTKLMAMVKAFGYGSGAGEVAIKLQQQQVDYLAVAYADEGVALRKAGISLPIMVMSPDEYSFDVILNYNLEPEIFSLELLQSFQAYISKSGVQQYPVHLKLNTGMNRLGFEPTDLAAIKVLLESRHQLLVKSVFSHLVASENPEHDLFTKSQVLSFTRFCNDLQSFLGYSFMRHIANTACIFRHPEYQFDMVRLGIGMYGIDTAYEGAMQLDTVATLKTTVAQIRTIKSGSTVGYGRKGKVEKDSVIATVRIGYADGYNRRLGNGRGEMYLGGRRAKVIGNVCMDMTMLDITGIPNVKVGDIVEVFGKHISLIWLAEAADTIPYEIMTSVNQRVKRVYFEE